MMRNTIEDVAGALDELDWRYEGMGRTSPQLAICIKNYDNLSDVKFPIELGCAAYANGFTYEGCVTQFTDPGFTAEWICDNITDDVLSSYFSDTCSDIVSNWIDELDAATPERWYCTGRSGGWLTCDVTQESIMGWTMEDLCDFVYEKKRIEEMVRKYNPWEDVARDIYANFWEDDE